MRNPGNNSVKQNLGNRLFWADNLRVLATFGVIILHVTPNLLYQKEEFSGSVWWISAIYTGTFRFCVPVFVMLTGSLLLSREYDLSSFLREKFMRIVIPCLFWSAIYILFNFTVEISKGKSFTPGEAIKSFLVQLRFGSSFHLWYVYMIIGIYLFIPIIGRWIRSCREKEILYFLLIWLLSITLNLPLIIKIKPAVDLTYFSGFIGYLVLGYYLSNKTFINKKKVTITSASLFIIGILITISGTYFFSKYKGEFRDNFYTYLTPNVALASIGIFLFIKNNYISNNRISAVISFFTKYNYGIYLIHVMILFFLSEISINWNLFNPVLGIPVTTTICLLLSGSIIYVFNRIPFLKGIVG